MTVKILDVFPFRIYAENSCEMVPLQVLALCALTVSWDPLFGSYPCAREFTLSCRVQASSPEILFPLPFCCHRSLCISDSDFLLFHSPGVLMLINSYTCCFVLLNAVLGKCWVPQPIYTSQEDLYIFE